MKTELNGLTSSADRAKMDDESRERANGFLPAGVAQVPKEELQRYLKCKRIGNYLLGKTIGEGSFARVKQGFHVLTGEKVAVKIIDKKQAHQDKYVARNMRREAKIMQMIRHPNIVQLLEVVETEHRYYLITELAAGGDLMDYICYRRKLGEVEVRKFIRQTVSAVHYLHQGGILHRDLKVENLLLDDDYNIKIIDFGLSNTMFAQLSDGHSTREFLKTQCGSPAYAAPEILGHKPYGPEVDVWSIGVNMFAMLTGKLPYTAEPFHITTLYNKMKTNDMNPIPDHLSASCKDLIRRFLTFNREQRITLDEALNHEWLRKGFDGPVKPVVFPNYPREEEMDKNILRHMTEKMDFNQKEVIDAVTLNRSTPTATVYHLLQRKLKKYYIRHPEKAKLIANAEITSANSESVISKDSCGTSQEKENKNIAKKRHECTVATAVVCDFNANEEKTQNGHKKSDSTKLDVLLNRNRLSSASSENLSAPNEKLPEGKNGSMGDADSAKLENETEHADKPETCNIFSNAGIEISRKDSCNYSSVEVMAVKGRNLSLNLSHISVESKATGDELKDTSAEKLNERGGRENEENGTMDKAGSPRFSEAMPALTKDNRTQKSPRNAVPSTPSKVGKVSVFNSKVISIPLQHKKQDSVADKAKLSPRRFSLPQTFFPPRNLGTNQQGHPVTNPFSFSSSSSSTETKRKNRHSLPPYGLCCQLTAIKAQDEENIADVSRDKEDKSLTDHVAQCNGLDAKPGLSGKKFRCSPKSSEKSKQRRKTVTTSGGKELLKSINNTLGKLMEVQDRSEPVKGHLLRSRLPPATLMGRKSDSPLDDVKISLIQENAAVERVKEKRNPGLKISCKVKDTLSQMPQVLSTTSRSESNSPKVEVRGIRRRRKGTNEDTVPLIAKSDSLSRHEDGKNLQRHLHDTTCDSSQETARDRRTRHDSLDEII